MDKLFVLVFLDTLELHQHADQNVSLVLNVLRMKLVTIRNVLTLVLAHVVSMQTVKYETIIQFVVVLQDIWEILS
jgi:hypothetical protein